MNATYQSLAVLPTAEISAMFKAHLPSFPLPTKKSEACQALASHAHNLGLSIDDLRQPPVTRPASVKPTHNADLTAQIGAMNAAITTAIDGNRLTLGLARDVEGEFRQFKTDMSAQTKSLDGRIKDLSVLFKCDIRAVRDDLQALADTVAARPQITIDRADIDAVVLTQINAAFGAFKSQVIEARAEAAVADTAAALSICSTADAESVFGVKVENAAGQTMNLTLWNKPDAPAVDQCFIWTPQVLRHLLLAAQSGSTLANVWLGGEKGAGKSETARQFAARTGRTFTRINFQRFTTAEDFLGATSLVNGSTAFEPGAFLKAYTTPGSVILLDEITNADPGVLNLLNGFLEPGASVNFGGKAWSKAPGVLILAADNTLGNGDQSGRYAGTRAQGAPLLNRFGQVVHMTFLPSDVERAAVVKRTGCSDKLAKYVLDAIAVARAKVQAGEIIDAPSIRNVMAFIEALAVLPVRAAWDATIAASQPAESAVALQQVFESCISEATIAKLI